MSVDASGYDSFSLFTHLDIFFFSFFFPSRFDHYPLQISP